MGTFDFATCPIDNNVNSINPPAQNCETNGMADASTSFYKQKAKGSCCDMCVSIYSQGLGCLSNNIPDDSNLVSSIINYQGQVSGSKAPTMPRGTSANDAVAMGQRVSGGSKSMANTRAMLCVIEPRVAF